jgi:hypothetical protein
MSRAMRATRGSLLLCSLLFAGCESKRVEPAQERGANEPSPNVSIVPAPLASGAELAINLERDAGRALSDAGSSDAGASPPRALRGDRALPAAAQLREASGIALEARFRWLDAAAAPRVPETNADGLGRARDKTEFDLALDLAAAGRLRMALASPAFALPEGAELRAAAELYGHVLVWPARRAYTILSPGMLRAVLAERRTDVVPLVPPKVDKLGAGNILGYPTERIALTTKMGKLDLEQTPLAAAGGAGPLLCRLLLELISAEPGSDACGEDWVPVRAEFVWAGGGRLGFEVPRLSRKQEIEPASLALPPEGAEFRPSELPGSAPGMLLSDSELAEFRTRPAARVDRLPAGAPKAGLSVANRSDTPRYVLVDEVAVAWLRPGAEQLISGLQAGKYLLSARDFLGGEPTPAKAFELPARYVIGDEGPK